MKLSLTIVWCISEVTLFGFCRECGAFLGFVWCATSLDLRVVDAYNKLKETNRLEQTDR